LSLWKEDAKLIKKVQTVVIIKPICFVYKQIDKYDAAKDWFSKLNA